MHGGVEGLVAGNPEPVKKIDLGQIMGEGKKGKKGKAAKASKEVVEEEEEGGDEEA